MNQRFVLAFALCAPGVVGCFQELDTTAAKNFPTDPDAGPSILTGGIDIECINASGKCSNPCEATTVQARDILTNHCGACHNGPGQGAPFDFILDFDKLKTERSLKPAAEFPPMDPLDPTQKMRFLVPGIPENSWIFVRAAIKGDMPPPGAVQHPNPKPTISDQSVLREWITTCMGPSERPAGGTGGATAAGGTTGGGGRRGGAAGGAGGA